MKQNTEKTLSHDGTDHYQTRKHHPIKGQSISGWGSIVPLWERAFPDKKASSRFGTEHFQVRMHCPATGRSAPG